MSTMNISLPGEMKDWVEAQSQGGRYANSSDYMRDLIRRDQERQEAKAWLEAEIEKGFAGGPAKPFDYGQFKARMHSEWSNRGKS